MVLTFVGGENCSPMTLLGAEAAVGKCGQLLTLEFRDLPIYKRFCISNK